jgi:hypothetical protein
MFRMVGGTLVAVFLLGCDAERIRGQRIEFLGSPVAITADKDENRISRIVTTIPFDAIQNAPLGATAQSSVGQMDFPPQVRSETFADFLQIAWNPQGDPQGLLAPSFALRFFDLDGPAVTAISCQNQPDVSQDRIPLGFNLPPATSPGGCVPGLGRLATSPAAAPSGPGRTVVLGFDGGRMVMVEVELSRDLLLTQQSFIVPLPRPVNLGTTTRFPTHLVASFRTDLNAWEFALDELVTLGP